MPAASEKDVLEIKGENGLIPIHMPEQTQDQNSKHSGITITKSQLTHHWKERLKGNNLGELKVTYADADYFEELDPHLDPNTVIYEEYVKEATPEEGHLNWGHLTVYPGRVNDEYFCTRGYFPKNPSAEQYYLCMNGNGLIMYMNRNGDCWCEELEEGSLHHTPEGVARRIINLSDEPLMLSTCKPANSGEDYDAIAEHPFPCHIYDDDGEMAIRVDLREEDASDEADIEELLRQ